MNSNLLRQLKMRKCVKEAFEYYVVIVRHATIPPVPGYLSATEKEI